MPINLHSNNRILNPNARAVDVAKAAIEAIAPVQIRKADAAFQVNGYSGILYSYLELGVPCACKAKSRAINARLNQDGKASPGAINELLNPNNNFGVRPYGEKRLPTPAYSQESQLGYSFLEVNLGQKPPVQKTPVPLSSLFDEDDLDTANRSTAGLPRVSVDIDGNSGQSNLLVGEDPDNFVQTEISNFDTGMFGMTDASCPICFGSGFVGGYSPYSAYRKVLTFQDPSTILPDEASVLVGEEIPRIQTTKVSWTVLLPSGCLGIDAFRLWNLDIVIANFVVAIDGIVLTKEMQVLAFCDGRSHLITFTFDKLATISHFEIQLNQTTSEANFELPRLNKSSNLSLRERTDPFTINLSPRIPSVKALDIIVESTYGKVLQVKGVTGLSDRRQTSLAWDAEVRPTQPQELFNLLPRRYPTSQLRNIPMVRDNSSPQGFTSRT